MEKLLLFKKNISKLNLNFSMPLKNHTTISESIDCCSPKSLCTHINQCPCIALVYLRVSHSLILHLAQLYNAKLFKKI